MSITHVPVVAPMKKREIENRVHRLLAAVSPKTLESPGPTPMEEIAEFSAPLHLGYSFEPRDLGHALGMMIPGKPPEVLLDLSTYEDLLLEMHRARFTAAHETGHADLHAHQLVDAMVSMRPGQGTLYRRPRRELQAFRDPEWQANYYAGCMLIPGATLLPLLRQGVRDPGQISIIYNTSLEVAEIRLQKLDIQL